MFMETFIRESGSYLAILVQLPWSVYALLLALGGATVAVRVTLARSGRIPPGVARASVWLLLLILVYILEVQTAPLDPDRTLFPPLLILKTVIWWFLFKHLLDGLYADLYRDRIVKQPVNQFFVDLCKFALLLAMILGALVDLFDLRMSSIMTSSAIVTAIIGFSVQDTISSFVSGLLIQLERPFAPGDWISTGQLTGRVVQITWRYTKIQTIDTNTILIPNNVIGKDNITNYSHPIAKVRQEVRVPFPLEVPPVKAKTILRDLLRNSSLVCDEPAPLVRAEDIQPDRQIFTLIFFVRQFEDLRPARDEVLAGAWYTFRKYAINLPYPVRELRRTRRPDAPPHRDAGLLLRNIPFLAALPDDKKELLLGVAAHNSFDAGAVIVRQGGTGNSMSILLEGEVTILRDGREVARLREGDFFGEMALLTGEPRTADVVATTPVQSLEIDREAFKLVLEKNQDIIDSVQAVFEQRAVEDKMQQVVTDSLFERFRRLFL